MSDLLKCPRSVCGAILPFKTDKLLDGVSVICSGCGCELVLSDRRPEYLPKIRKKLPVGRPRKHPYDPDKYKIKPREVERYIRFICKNINGVRVKMAAIHFGVTDTYARLVIKQALKTASDRGWKTETKKAKSAGAAITYWIYKPEKGSK